MNQQELEALLAQMGVLGPNDFREEVKQETAKEIPPGALEPVDVKKDVTYRTWVKPGTNQRLTVKVNPDGTYTKVFQGADDAIKPAASTTSDAEWHTEGRPDGQGGFDNSRPIMVRTVNGVRQTKEPNAKELEDWNLTGQMGRNPGGKTDAQIAAEQTAAETRQRQKDADARAEADRNKPQVIPGSANTTSKRVGFLQADGTIKWEENPNYNRPNPQPISAPPNVRSLVFLDADGKPVTEKNPAYRPPSKVDKDPETGQMIEITEDEDGKPVIRPVRREGTATPSPAAVYPQLQARAGEISQTYTKKAEEIWGRHQRGEITQKERDDELGQLTAQATTQMNEVNSVLSNSRAIWDDQIRQRSNTLTDDASRRQFASSILTEIGRVSSGSATDAAGIGRNVTALAKLGLLLGNAAGGMKESPEIEMPGAVKQARDFTLPGFSPPNAAGFGATPESITPSAAVPSGADVAAQNAATQAQSQAAFEGLGIPPSAGSGPDFTTPDGRFGIPAGQLGSPTPAPAIEAPSAGPPVRDDWRQPPPVNEPGNDPTPPVSMDRRIIIRPDATIEINHAPASPLAQMGSRLQPRPTMGTPVSAGGGGAFDLHGEAQAMIGDGSDPEWAAAVRDAAGSLEEQVWGRRRA